MSRSFEKRIDCELLRELRSFPPLGDDSSTLEEIRSNLKCLDIPDDSSLDTGIVIENRLIPGPPDNPSLRIKTYSPIKRSISNLPVLLWVHGGGFISGTVCDDDWICQRIAKECNCVVVSVDYRLAPKHPFPAGFDDCYVALEWLATRGAVELDVRSCAIGVGGCSAGACIAAGITLKARDHKGPKIAFQTLLIPVLDDRHITPSSIEVTDIRVWNRALSKKAWAAYLRGFPGDNPGYAVPARAEDLSRLPPVFISVEECDLLRDEAILYAQRLMQSQVQTELHVYPGTFHGSMFLAPKADVSKSHFRDMLHALNKKLNQ